MSDKLPQEPSNRITLSGDLGSGKSSVGKRLAATLGIPYYSAGALFRDIGRIDNLDALNTNLAAENNTAIDAQVDARTKEIDRSVPGFVIDSRMAWHFVRNALRVYLAVSRDTAAHRIMGDGRSGETYPNHPAAVAALGERRASEAKRYRQLYRVDIMNLANYDLVVVTDDAALDDITGLVVAAARRKVRHKFWLPKSRLVPLIACPRSMPGAESPVESIDPMPLTLVHNFGFYSGQPDLLAAALASGGAFIPYDPQPSGADSDILISKAKRVLTPGGLHQWAQHSGAGRSFAALLGPARP
jgi:predicted cytidylate kinase